MDTSWIKSSKMFLQKFYYIYTSKSLVTFITNVGFGIDRMEKKIIRLLPASILYPVKLRLENGDEVLLNEKIN